MYTFGVATSRCILCYALLYNNNNSSAISHSSLNRRRGSRCSLTSIEQLISSSRKIRKLWLKNENRLISTSSICYRCCDIIRQIEQITNHIEQLNNEQHTLINKIEHNLYKRALILQGRKQRTNECLSYSLNHQQIPSNDDDDTEEGEEKPRIPAPKINGHEHSSSIIMSTTTLVGAKRRKSKIAHKIKIEDKSSSLNRTQQSDSLKANPSKILSNTHPSKHHRTGIIATGTNGHAKKINNTDLNNLAFSTAYKSLTLPITSSTAAATPPFIDPTTGALIAIVSNPHHAALLAQQHQQLFKNSPISSTSTNVLDDHDIIQPKQQSPKKFPCQLCGRDFSNKSNLNRHHSIVHVAIRNFECARCPKKFKLRQGLKTHMQRCHGVNTDEPTFVMQKHHAHHQLHHS